MLAAAQGGDAVILFLLATVIGMFGAAFFVSATVMLERRLKALRFGAKLAAIVVRLAPPPAWPGGIQPVNNVPWVRYRNPDGQTREASLAPPHPRRISQYFPVGKELVVRVDPQRPDVAYQASLMKLLLGPSVMLIGGGLSLLIAWGIWNGM